MPLYVYLCRSCENRFEQLRTFADRLELAVCPECQSEAQFTLSLTTPAFVGSASGECGSEGGGAVGPGGCGAGCTCVSN